MPADTALRTLRSSNGLTVVLSEIQRPLPPGTSAIWSFCCVSACLRIAGGGGWSPVIMLWPSMILRAITVASSLPCWTSISST